MSGREHVDICPFIDENGIPKPLIFVGENGGDYIFKSGKCDIETIKGDIHYTGDISQLKDDEIGNLVTMKQARDNVEMIMDNLNHLFFTFNDSYSMVTGIKNKISTFFE